MSRRATLKDVAEASGVSVASVSLVLNRRANRLSRETREHIREAAEKLHYVPNQNARSLVTNHSMLLALLVPDIENQFFASLAKAIEDAAAGEGYSLIVANSDDSRVMEQSLLTTLNSRNIDGLFLIPASESLAEVGAIKTDIAHMDCPVVLLDRLVNQDWCDSVGSDNYFGGKLAAEALLKAGHTRIGCISGDSVSGNAEARERGFVEELEKAGVDMPDELKADGYYRFIGGYKAAEHIIEESVTAIFCCNDLMALGCIERARQKHLRIPEDLTVIGYDNVMERLGITVPMATFDQGIPSLALAAHDEMKKRIDQGQAEEGFPKKIHTLVRPHFVNSSAVKTFERD